MIKALIAWVGNKLRPGRLPVLHEATPAPAKAQPDRRTLRYPQRRKELIGLLQELSDPLLQKSCWIDHEDVPLVSGIDEIFHFFFDDTDLAGDPHAEIGYILINAEEALCIKALTDVLDDMLARLGNARSGEFMADHQWPSVMTLARNVLSVMTANDAG